jgi:hypothetical protein
MKKRICLAIIEVLIVLVALVSFCYALHIEQVLMQ